MPIDFAQSETWMGPDAAVAGSTEAAVPLVIELTQWPSGAFSGARIDVTRFGRAMITLLAGTHMSLACEATDMRKGFDSGPPALAAKIYRVSRAPRADSPYSRRPS
jgi:hypothetical protein